MIRSLFATSASALALVISAPVLAEGAPQAATITATPAEVPTPTMSFGTWGVDTTLLSKTVRPGEDFFGYVNQEWLDANPLPAEYSRFGAFNLLREKSTSDIKAVIDGMVEHEAHLSASDRRVVSAYKAFLDTDAIEAAGLAPAQPALTEIAGAKSLEELVEVWSVPGMPGPVGAFVTVDQKAPDTYAT